MNKRQAKKRKKFEREKQDNTIYWTTPTTWSEIRWAKQIKAGKLSIK